MGDRYDDLTALLERFDWLADSLVHSISLERDLRHDIRATLLIRVIDDHDGLAENTLKLVLNGVDAFKLQQASGFTTFETSQEAGIARDGPRLLLDLGGPQGFTEKDVLPDDFASRAKPRHLTVEDVRERSFYLDFADFAFEILPAGMSGSSSGQKNPS